MPAPSFTSRTAIAATELNTTVHVQWAGEAFSVSTHDVHADDTRQPTATDDKAGSAEPATSTEGPPNRPHLRVHQPLPGANPTLPPPSRQGKRPLSSFTGSAHEDSPQALTKIVPHPARALEPGTTVAEFRWPTVCQALGAQCTDHFNRAADALLAQAEESSWLVGVMGLHAGQGCTTTLLCLAARLAARNRRVIVVDANFASPQLASSLGVAPATAWQDVLERGVPVAKAVIRSSADRLDLLPLDNRPTSGLRLATGLQPAITSGVLLDAYDLVLVDLGAIFEPLSQACTLELVRNMRMDAALVVTGPGPGDPRELGVVAQLLRQRGCEPLGTIENRVS